MEDYFSIGELSKYQNISKQTLIYYDKIGLFRPAYVDPDNGYRYYSSGQIDYLDTILIMKKIGFSLKEIRELLRHGNIETSLLALRKQLTVIDRQIRELQMIKSRLQKRCDQMEKAKEYRGKECSAVVEHVPARCILFERVEEPYAPREVSIATKKCFSEAFLKQLPIFFQCGVRVPLENIRKGNYTEASEAFVSTEWTDRAEQIRELPGGKCASIYHIGDYPSIGRSYRKLLAYCEEQKLRIISDAYEFCINDYITSSDESDYITKIMLYVE